MEDEEESEAEWLGKRIETQRFFEDFDLLVGCLEKVKTNSPNGGLLVIYHGRK